jgi:hypothetical protein
MMPVGMGIMVLSTQQLQQQIVLEIPIGLMILMEAQAAY